MPTRAEQFAGLSVAIVTPFKDGAVDIPRLREQIEFQVAAGVTCICPVGTTGESPTLSHDEHERVIAESVQAAAGRILVMPGTGSNSTAEAVRLTRFAEKAGANAALVVGPYYNRPTQPGLVAHFKALAEATTLPICVYNIPARTGRNIEPETIIRLAELPGIAMVKEATGSMDQASQVLAATDLTVLSGDDSMTLPLLAIGGRGVVSVVGNIVPADMKGLCAAFDRGDLGEARRLHHRLFGLCRDLLGMASNPIPIKAAMAMLGRDSGEIRLPLVPLEAPHADTLRGVLRAYGLPVST
jgi:4-hydroxy-tetrahydrodipicolinate synthase